MKRFLPQKIQKQHIILASIFLALLCLPSLIAIFHMQKPEPGLYDYKILQKYGLDNVTNLLRINSIDNISVDKSKHDDIGFFSASFSGIKVNLATINSKDKFISNLQTYSPFLDFFNKFPETLVIGGCGQLNANASINVFPINDINHYKALITAEDNCVGKISFDFTILNMSSLLLDNIQSHLNLSNFTALLDDIETDNITLSISPSLNFIKNYFAIETANAYIPNFIPKNKKTLENSKENNSDDMSITMLDTVSDKYEQVMESSKVPQSLIDNNMQTFKLLMDKNFMLSYDFKDSAIKLQLNFTTPAKMSKAKALLPFIVLSLPKQ